MQVAIKHHWAFLRENTWLISFSVSKVHLWTESWDLFQRVKREVMYVSSLSRIISIIAWPQGMPRIILSKILQWNSSSEIDRAINLMASWEKNEWKTSWRRYFFHLEAVYQSLVLDLFLRMKIFLYFGRSLFRNILFFHDKAHLTAI